MKIICLVCCREGSKGIKNKNIKNFNGKPLLYWISESIKKSKIFDKIYLSTDSEKIAKIGKNLNFDVAGLRPKKLATNNSDVFKTFNYFFKKNKIKDNNSVVCIVQNNPFISHEDLKKSYSLFKNNKFKYVVMPIIKVDSVFHHFRQGIKKKNGRIKHILEREFLKSSINRQNYKNQYVNTGDIRWGRPSHLKNYQFFKKKIQKEGYIGLPLNLNKFNDLNDMNDWKIALKKFKILKRN